MHGLWVLERLGKLDDRTLETALRDPEAAIRTHAMMVLSERPWLSPETQRQLLKELGDADDKVREHAKKVLSEVRWLSPAIHRHLVEGLKDPDGFVRRAAADGLGRHPALENLRPLLDLRHVVPAEDTHLLHVVRMALRDQLLPVRDWMKLPRSAWSERDQKAVADVATGVPNAEAAIFLMNHLEHLAEGRENQERYVYHVARYGPEGMRRRLLQYLEKDKGDLQQQVALLKAIQQGAQARGAALHEEARKWAEGLARGLLNSGNQNDVLAGIDLCGSFKLTAAQDLLDPIVRNKDLAEASRSAAMTALVTIDPGKQVALLGKLLGDAGESFALRDKAARALAGINQPPAQEELLKHLATAPEKLAIPIAAGLAVSPAGAERLLAAMEAGKASARLLQERHVEVNLQRSNPPQLKERLAKLTQGLPPADTRVLKLMSRRRDGFAKAKADPALGATVFEKSCAICHQIGNKGARVGPNLDGIGIRGTDRLLEDILDPSRNVDQEFRLSVLTLTNGQIVSGLVLREEGEVLVVADSQGKEVRVPKKQVEERAVSPLSPMPANLGDQIPEGDFYHLLAYLLTQQPSKDNKPTPRP